MEEESTNFDFDSQIKELKNEIAYLQDQKSKSELELQNLMESEPLVLKNSNGTFKNEVRACYQDLVLCGVGTKETKTVIISVLKNFAGINVTESELPGPTFARNMYEEARLLAFAQLGTTLSKDFEISNNTLQSDGT